MRGGEGRGRGPPFMDPRYDMFDCRTVIMLF